MPPSSPEHANDSTDTTTWAGKDNGMLKQTFLEDGLEDEDEDEDEDETQDALDNDLPLEAEDEQQPIEVEEGPVVSAATPIRTESTSKKNRTAKDPTDFRKIPGKSLFPVSRVQKIIKADKDIPIVAKDAVFLISLATEEFIKRIVVAGHRTANQENRSTVQHKDIASVVRRIDEFLFLEDLMPWITPVPKAKRAPEEKEAGPQREPTALDQFINPQKGPMGGTMDQDPPTDVVMGSE